MSHIMSQPGLYFTKAKPVTYRDEQNINVIRLSFQNWEILLKFDLHYVQLPTLLCLFFFYLSLFVRLHFGFCVVKKQHTLINHALMKIFSWIKFFFSWCFSLFKIEKKIVFSILEVWCILFIYIFLSINVCI